MTTHAETHIHLTPTTSINRILNGMWQVSGAHGFIDRQAALQNMFTYHDAGLTTWDLADHYGPAEDLIGDFRRRLADRDGPEALDDLLAFTKWVPRPGPMTKAIVEQNIGVSLHRMQVDALDMLQFHWWDYADERYLDAMQQMATLQLEGKINLLSLTNFDTKHLERIEQAGVKIISNQVQFSLVDMRPLVAMAPYCEANHVKLLTYGTLCGGLLSEKYLDAPEPKRSQLNTASLSKYKNMIDTWGGWALFQQLLQVVNTIAQKHNVSIANVATRFILEQPGVGGVIIGARLGISEHIDDNLRVFSFALGAEDREQINTVLAKSRDLFQLIGDCGDEYRRR